MIQTTIHPKACRQCGREFMPQRSIQAVKKTREEA